MADNRNLEDIAILWICPLAIEAAAAMLMLDNVYDEIPRRKPQQTLQYIMGRMWDQDVAIVSLPEGEVGMSVSGSVAAEILRDLPLLKFAFLVGISAGLPSESKNDIRLGDVAIAFPGDSHSEVIGYTQHKIMDNDHIELKGFVNATHRSLRSTYGVIRIRAINSRVFGKRDAFLEYLKVLEEYPSAKEFQRPGDPQPCPVFSFPSERHSKKNPVAHYRAILSGDTVVKSKDVRDKLRDKYNAICIEMEAAGILNQIPAAVIRGISDFGDSSKNDEWHGYASVTAAAYAKEMVRHLGTKSELEKDNIGITRAASQQYQLLRLNQALPQPSNFVGRAEDLDDIDLVLGARRENWSQNAVLALWGLVGVGKTQLAYNYVKRQLEKYPERLVFWIQGQSKEEFERSIIHIFPAGYQLQEETDEKRREHVQSFFGFLNTLENDWLLVLDDLSAGTFKKDGSHLGMTDFRTTGISSHVADVLTCDDSLAFLAQEISHSTSAQERRTLTKLVIGHPLALRLAITAINNYKMGLATYCRDWSSGAQDTHIARKDHALTRTLDMNFEYLESSNGTAAKALKLFGFLDHKDFWYNLCLGAVSFESPEWLRDFAYDASLFRETIESLAQLSFINWRENGTRDGTHEIHPAIHNYARQRAQNLYEDIETAQIAANLVAASVPRTHDELYWETAKRLEPHAEQCMRYLKAKPHYSYATLDRFASLYRLLGRHEDAIELYNSILESMAKREEEDVDLTADILGNLGLTYFRQGKDNETIQTYERSMEKRRMGAENPQIPRLVLFNLCEALIRSQRMKEAKTYLQITEKGFEDATDDEDVIYSSRVTAWLADLESEEYGGREKAVKMFRDAIKLQEKYLDEKHPILLGTRHKLANTCVDMSNCSEACNILEDLVVKYRECWGEDHDDTKRWSTR